MSRRRAYLLFAAAFFFLAAFALALRRFLAGIPDYRTLEEYTPALTTRIYDARGEVAAELSIEKRALLTLSQIPVDLQNAVIASEDSRFFKHWGLSPTGLLRAAVVNFLKGRVVQGGSTLTQQLAKLIFLSPERKLLRKIKEMLLSIQLERNFSKEEILQFYLNQINFGHGAYGVQAAARLYFNKDPQQLTLGECALLAGVIPYPGGYSPFRRPERAAQRRRLVLQRMVEEGFIREEEAQKAVSEPLPTQRGSAVVSAAPYFVEHVRRRLEPKYGTQTLWRGGLKIYTTLDLEMQEIVNEEMEKALSAYDVKAREDWQKQLDADLAAGVDPPTVSTSPPADIQGAFLILDVKTGAIRAMTGGRGGDQFNRVVQARRQPGSTFKPFVWAAGLGAGLSGASLVEDAPLAYYYDGRDWRLLEGATDQYAIMAATTPFAASEFKVWVPNNYDGKFMGVITLRKALALSRNIASVRLIEHVGPPRVIDLAAKAGIESPLEPVLSLGLGSSVVSPLELGSAFATFANGGIRTRPFSVVRVEDARGGVLEQNVPKEEEALSPQLAYLVTHLLKAVVEGGTGRGAARLRRPLAGKTGTTNEHKDLWFIGFTPDLLALAWMGYDDASMGGKDRTGGSTVVPWWTAIMERVLKDYPPRDFPVPEDVVFARIDADTGLLALPTCPRQVLQAFRSGTEPKEYCPHDHGKPLSLKPAFSPSGEGGFSVQPSEPEEPAPLPTEEELESEE